MRDEAEETAVLSERLLGLEMLVVELLGKNAVLRERLAGLERAGLEGAGAGDERDGLGRARFPL